jgi:hypothetical protein
LRLFNEQGEELVFTDTDKLVVNDDNLSFNINEETIEYVDPDFPDLVFESSSDRTFRDGKKDSKGNYLKERPVPPRRAKINSAPILTAISSGVVAPIFKPIGA